MLLIIIGVANCMITVGKRNKFSFQTNIRLTGYISGFIIRIIKSGDFARGEDRIVFLPESVKLNFCF